MMAVLTSILAAALALAGSSGDVRVIDGDTLVARVGLERVHLRLNGIDAPELHGCPHYRHCAPGDPVASKANLIRLVRGRTITWLDLGTDRYGRTIAEVRAGGVDLQCEQLRGGFAIYKPRWDNQRLALRTCGASAMWHIDR